MVEERERDAEHGGSINFDEKVCGLSVLIQLELQFFCFLFLISFPLQKPLLARENI